MTVLFTINFRREAYLVEAARRRRRVISLGVWVAYFGVLAMLIGLYGLNCASLFQRSRVLERQTAQLTQASAGGISQQLRQSELNLVERYARSTRLWRDRLNRLGELIPPTARITTLTVNPQNMSDPAAQNMLVITGELRAGPNQDRMQGVMNIVGAMRRDSVFVKGYSNVKLASTRVDQEGNAEFVIECR